MHAFSLGLGGEQCRGDVLSARPASLAILPAQRKFFPILRKKYPQVLISAGPAPENEEKSAEACTSRLSVQDKEELHELISSLPKKEDILIYKPLSEPRRKAPRPEWGAWWKCCERVKYTAPSRRAMRRYVVFPYYFYERYFPFWTMKKFTDENCANCMKDADSMLPCFSSKCVPGRSPKSGVVVRWKYVAILILSSMLIIFDRLVKSLFRNLRL